VTHTEHYYYYYYYYYYYFCFFVQLTYFSENYFRLSWVRQRRFITGAMKTVTYVH